MVRLSSIPARSAAEEADKSDNAIKQKQTELAKSLGNSEAADEFTTSVYGSKFAGQTLPKDEIPEGEMPRDIAYRMIKDDLSLDGNPRLK